MFKVVGRIHRGGNRSIQIGRILRHDGCTGQRSGKQHHRDDRLDPCGRGEGRGNSREVETPEPRLAAWRRHLEMGIGSHAQGIEIANRFRIAAARSHDCELRGGKTVQMRQLSYIGKLESFARALCLIEESFQPQTNLAIGLIQKIPQ